MSDALESPVKTAPAIKYPVELLRDGKGIYGIGAVAKEINYPDLILRRDRLQESDPHCYIRPALQMITGGFRHGMFSHAAEEHFRQEIHHGMLRRAGLPWPPHQEDDRNLRWWSSDPEQQAHNRRIFHGLRLGSLSIINKLIGRALEEAADREAVMLARRFRFRDRYAVYRATAMSPRALQITAVFPALGLAIFAPDVATDRAREARRLVEDGERLNKIAELMGVPLAFRNVKPGAARTALAVAGAFEDPRLVDAYMPQSLPKMKRWLRSINLANELGPDFVRWVAKYALEIGSLEEVKDIGDWVRSCYRASVPPHVLRAIIGHPLAHQQQGEQFVHRQFNADMSLATVIKLNHEWHEAVAANMSGPNAKFPEPWAPGAETCGLNIIPITTNSELYREGATMRNCVGTYAHQVQLGDVYIYSVRRSGERVATLELVRNRSLVAIGELRGPCNTQAPKEISRAVRSWLRDQRGVFRLPNPNARRNLGELFAPDDEFATIDEDIPF